ncbi:homocysteine biosynthesis protein [Methanorbis furvi]|uniref:Inosine-5'-monophosphate dehydrogenase n=1 Tax=Methanorbis furvi TaxID=3028299 RepID=A0AAE4MC90_9EURY|nr:Inosine-5'-monophosphate dehydrogenase [Methanocorpusculaceae archaeon Ag1]
MYKSIDDINERIRDGSVRVVTAEEMPDIVDELGVSGALREVDVVTTGTFGAMCSSGAFLNFGHSEIPIRMEKMWLNGVEAYAGIAAVDCYIGATQESITKGIEYGGAHVIEDLIAGKAVELRARGKGTDCYPRQSITNEFTLADLNQAIMLNPRNSYQCYNAATNMTNRPIKTYMGYLLPGHRNITYSGAGALSPLPNDPTFSVIGSGTPIFLGGANGTVVGEGTQHSPGAGFGTLMTTGDIKEMSLEYIRAATMTGYGVTMYVGVGVPIPLLNEDIVKHTAVRDEDLVTSIVDYGTQFRDRPVVKKVTYQELKSGSVEIDGEEIKTSPLSSYKKAREVANELKARIENGSFLMASATRPINAVKKNRPMSEHGVVRRVSEMMVATFVTITGEKSVKEAATLLLKANTNHLPVIDAENRLTGIVTTFDISKAFARDEEDRSVSNIMTRNVITAVPDEPVDLAARRLLQHNIGALVVVDPAKKVLGMLNSQDLGDLVGERWHQ